MDTTFNPDAFIRRIGQRLVSEFDDARGVTTPGTVGSAMEAPVRRQLQQILPRGIAVGSGFVIDSYGETSRQGDINTVRAGYLPVFSINGTPETTYYPCECVIAVGEVKSALGQGSLQDAFKKIASVRRSPNPVLHNGTYGSSFRLRCYPSGRSCSDGRTVVFNGQAEGPHGAPDRRHTRGRGEGVLQLRQRAIRVRAQSDRPRCAGAARACSAVHVAGREAPPRPCRAAAVSVVLPPSTVATPPLSRSNQTA